MRDRPWIEDIVDICQGRGQTGAKRHQAVWRVSHNESASNFYLVQLRVKPPG